MKKILLLLCILFSTKITFAQDETDVRSGKFFPAVDVSLGYVIPNLGDASNYYDSAWGLSMQTAFGARYYAHENFFMEALAGYKWIIIDTKLKGDSQTTISTVHNITFPLHLGIHFSDVRVFAGTRIDVPVSSYSEYGAQKNKTSVPVTALVEGGIAFKKIQFLVDYSPSENYTLLSIGLKM